MSTNHAAWRNPFSAIVVPPYATVWPGWPAIPCRGRAVPQLATHEVEPQRPEEDVQPDEQAQRDGDLLGGNDPAHAIRRAHHTVDDPRLATDLRRGPAQLDRDQREWRRQHRRAEPEGAPEEAASPEVVGAEGHHEQHQRAEP